MPTGIMITGPSGAGKTTLGKMVAEELGYAFVDVDDYIWRRDAEVPFSAMYSREEKISRLQDAISACEHFVMAGSMDSFHEHFDPCFELVVHLRADAQIRVERVKARERASFGDRILEGGDMHEAHLKMLHDIAGYDHGTGGCTLQQHEKWLNSLACKTMCLDGADTLDENLSKIVKAYKGR